VTTHTLGSCRDRALAILRRPGATLYGIIDAANGPEILALIRDGGCPFESLFQGESAIAMASVAPYLVQLPPQAPLLETLIAKGWGNNWGIYVTSRLPLAEVRRHFRHFTMVELPDGRVVYFRFYDPRVFRVFIPTCNPVECRTILDGIEFVYAEGTDGSSMNTFRLGEAGALRTETLFRDGVP
jgi:hypothetical protein